MTHSELIDQVRRLVAQSFAELPIPAAGPIRESILLRGDAYCGRRFETEGAHAVWFIDEGQIKVFSDDGRVVRTLSASQAQPLRPRLAA